MIAEQTQSHSFHLGQIKIDVLSDGVLEEKFDFATSFIGVDPDDLAKELQKHGIDIDRVSIVRNCLLVETGGLRVLIDAGLGHGWNGQLVSRLTALGVEADEIDHVVLTHCHGDHIAGTLDAAGGPTFPRAKLWLSSPEYRFWSDESRFGEGREYPADHPSIRALTRLKDSLQLITEEIEFLPGITAIRAGGHTAGHMALLIESQGEALLACGDAFSFLFQLENVTWRTRFDRLPDELVESRKKLLALAREKNAPIHAYHFPFPGIVQI